MQAFTQQIQPYLDQLKDLGWIGILAYAAAIVILQLIGVPLSPFGTAAGVLFGFRNGLLAITLGTNVGAALNFLIARYFARTMVTRWLGHHEKFRLIDRAIAREGGKIVALLRLCPIPFGLANYAYGLTSVRLSHYLLATFVAIIPANVFFVWIGSGVSKTLSTAGTSNAQTSGEKAFLVVGILALALAIRTVSKIAKAAIDQGEADQSSPPPDPAKINEP